MADTGNRTTVPLLDQAVTVSMVGSAMYFGLVYVVTRYSYRVNVGFGLACSLLLMAVGIVDPPLHAARPSASPSTGVPIKARLSRFTLAPSSS